MKMKRSKRILSLLLAAEVLLSMAVGCSESGTGETESTDSGSGGGAVPEETVEEEESTPAVDEGNLTDVEKRALIPDNLPEVTFNGKEFRAMVTEKAEYQYVVDEQTGETANDSIYNRNLRLEDRFGCKIKTVIEDYPYSAIHNFITSGDNVCEVVDHWEYMASQPISKGDYVDWNTIPYIDQNQPWWNKASNDGSTLNGKLFCIVGDLSITSMRYTYAMFFNMDLMEQHGYPSEDLYNMVFEGEWTLDKLQELVNNIYVDNGDGKKGLGDTFAYGYWAYHGTDVWVTAMGEHLTEKDPETDELTITLGTEKVYSTLERLVKMIYSDNGAIRFTGTDVENVGRGEFLAGHVGVMPLMFDDCYTNLRDMTSPYGILPYPKYDTAQINYYTNSMDQHSVFGLPKTVPTEDYDFVGIMMEALNAETYKTVYPEFYDSALKNRYSEDATTAQMIDLIMAGRVYEFSFQFGSYFQDLPYMFRNCLYQESTDLASTLQKSKKAMEKKMKALYELYEDSESGD